MNPSVLALVCVLGGIAIGLVAAWLYVNLKHPTENAQEADVAVPAQITQLFAALSNPAVLVGPHDEVLHATSRARTLGLARGSRIGVDALLDVVRSSRLTGEQATERLVLDRGRGVPDVHLAAHVTPLDEQMILVFTEDLSDEVRIQKTRKDFVANVSHELKTPIGAISLLAEAIEDAADDPDQVRKFATRLEVESTRLGALVQQIINLSRLQSRNPLLKTDEVSIDDAINQAVDRCRPLAESRRITLTVGDEAGATVLADGDQIIDALTNLVHNAIVYSDEGGRVVASSRQVAADDDHWVDVVVSDNGIGISDADQERIFERFYRVDYGRSRASGGTGLGLSIVAHTAQVYGGSVSVWSKLGHGSTFTVRLPAHITREENPT